MRIYHVGVTGTRFEPDSVQIDLLDQFLSLPDNATLEWVLHHGDCVGVDDIVNRRARVHGWITHSHPPISNELRAHSPSDVVHTEKGYLARDRDIVDACELLLAVPGTPTETYRSGTWYTIRYALKKDVPIIGFLPGDNKMVDAVRLRELLREGRWGE